MPETPPNYTMESILTSVKKLLGIEAIYDHFDAEIIIYINGVFADLNQLGVGPEEGFVILNTQETWAEYFGTIPNLETVKSYIYLKVRVIFDPPTTSAVLAAIERLIKETEWRLMVRVDPPLIIEEGVIEDDC